MSMPPQTQLFPEQRVARGMGRVVHVSDSKQLSETPTTVTDHYHRATVSNRGNQVDRAD